MIRLLTIIGARPQIIKAAAFSRAVAAWNQSHSSAEQVEEYILHTGQHYDENMSDVFFRELGIPAPACNLHCGSGTHGSQTARMTEGIEAVIAQAAADNKAFAGVVVYGDTNSTLAAAVAASKMHVPVFHIEAGLRSFNMAMPEEINRIVCDQLSSLLFAPTQTAVDNLYKEGFAPDGIKSRNRFANGKGQRVVLAGDVMYDNSRYFGRQAEQQSTILQRLALAPQRFVLATIHRPANTDAPERLLTIGSALSEVAHEKNTDVVIPLHPRTRQALPQALRDEWNANPRVHIIEPVSFFDMIVLEKNAQLILTDSGGVQKEAFFYGTPCVILRKETEWTEIVTAGAGRIADADSRLIHEACDTLTGKRIAFPPLFGDGHAAERILSEIISYLS